MRTIRISAVLGCLASLALAKPAEAQQGLSMTLQAREARSQSITSPSTLASMRVTPDSEGGVTRVVNLAKGQAYTIDLRSDGAEQCLYQSPMSGQWNGLNLENGAYHSITIDAKHPWYQKNLNIRCVTGIHENGLTHQPEFSHVAAATLVFTAK